MMRENLFGINMCYEYVAHCVFTLSMYYKLIARIFYALRVVFGTNGEARMLHACNWSELCRASKLAMCSSLNLYIIKSSTAVDEINYFIKFCEFVYLYIELYKKHLNYIKNI